MALKGKAIRTVINEDALLLCASFPQAQARGHVIPLPILNLSLSGDFLTLISLKL